MAERLVLKPGWLARDIAAAAEQVKKLKMPVKGKCAHCPLKDPTHD